MAEHHFVAGESALWLQKDGANTDMTFLGCFALGDITVPYGDENPIYCPADESGKFKVVRTVPQQADLPTTSLTGAVLDAISDLEITDGKFNLYILKIIKGLRNQYANWDRMFVLQDARKTEGVYAGLAAKTGEENNESTYQANIKAAAFFLPVRLRFTRSSVSEAVAANDIVFCNEATERSTTSVAKASCTEGYIAMDAGTGVPAEVLATSDGGSTWANTAANPFGNNEHILAVRCVAMDRTTTRIFAFRGVTDGSNPAELAYSDNGGATWVAVDIGADDGSFVVSPNAVYLGDIDHMWVGLDNGYIHFSSDAGLTWDTQEAGVVQSGAYRAIHFADKETGLAGGDDNTLLSTIDGGSTWSQVAMPSAEDANDITCVLCLDQNRFWVGYSDGKLYYTFDAGDNWYERTFTGSGSGAVKQIKFINELQGYMIHNKASGGGYVLQTHNGGKNWERVTSFANSNLNSMFICDPFKAWVVGEVNSGTFVIAKGLK